MNHTRDSIEISIFGQLNHYRSTQTREERGCVIHQPIHNNHRIKMLELAEQIENPRPMWISPAQTTIRSNFGFRAFVKSEQ
jgi:hypothetical protein